MRCSAELEHVYLVS